MLEWDHQGGGGGGGVHGGRAFQAVSRGRKLRATPGHGVWLGSGRRGPSERQAPGWWWGGVTAREDWGLASGHALTQATETGVSGRMPGMRAVETSPGASDLRLR